MTLTENIQNEIQTTVPQMIEDAVTTHTHNGGDSQQINPAFLSGAPQQAIGAPVSGSVIDVQARTAINDIISRLSALGLINSI